MWEYKGPDLLAQCKIALISNTPEFQNQGIEALLGPHLLSQIQILNNHLATQTVSASFPESPTWDVWY